MIPPVTDADRKRAQAMVRTVQYMLRKRVAVSVSEDLDRIYEGFWPHTDIPDPCADLPEEKPVFQVIRA